MSDQVHVVVGLQSGCLDETEVFKTAKAANEFERKICKDYGIPYGPKSRQEYYDNMGTHQVSHLIVEVK